MRRLRFDDIEQEEDNRKGEEETDAQKKLKRAIPHVDIVQFLETSNLDKDELMQFTQEMARTIDESNDMNELRDKLDGLVLGFQLKDAPYPVLKQIALHLPLGQISAFCRTNKAFSEICESQEFWKEKLFQDYRLKQKLADEGTWKDAYKMASLNPPQGKVHIFTKKGERYTFDFRTAEDELHGCEVVRFFMITMFPDFDTKRIGQVIFHGSRGYPIIAEYEAKLMNAILFFSINPNLGLFMTSSQGRFIRVEFVGNSVLDVMQDRYGEQVYSEWLEECGYAIEDTVFPHPMQIYEMSEEDNYRIISEMLDNILQMEVL